VAEAAVLAVDGGNSKTDVALVGRDGRIRGAARGAGSTLVGQGRAEGMAILAAAVEAAAADAGRTDDGPLAALGLFATAGADLPSDERRLARALAERSWARSNLVRNDTFAVLRAGTDRPEGVAVVCGAGINCVGVGIDGRVFRFPALGALSGDWGGGEDVGMAALGAAVRGADGRGPRTALERTVPEHFGLRTPAAVVRAVYAGRIDARRVLELPPVVFAAADDGDEVARAILDRLADEVVAMATAAISRVRLGGDAFDVVLGGGLFRGADGSLLGRIGAGIAAAAPRASLVRLTAPPIVGAVLLGLDELGAGSTAKRRAREALSEARLAGAGRR
jgi:N-acetylglucosamine kinase-like BadF-type ATPase